jgi:hypothetical protein
MLNIRLLQQGYVQSNPPSDQSLMIWPRMQMHT